MKKNGLTLRPLDKKLETAIDEMDCRRGKEFYNIFDEFLDLTLGLMCNNPNQHQIELLTKMGENEEYKAAYAKAVSAYGEAAANYHDPFGDIFMDRISHGNNGQFFTPEDLCQLNAQVMLPNDGYINDPTCGSGRILLAGLKSARERGFEPWICGQDLSYTCAKMTLLNLMINQARGYVTCGDTLRYEQEKWIYYRIDRVFTLSGMVLSTYWQYSLSEVDAIDEKRTAWIKKQMSEGRWVEIFKTPDDVKEQQHKEPQHIHA